MVEYWQRACKELSAADPVMEKLISVHKEDVLQGSGEALQTLVNAVVGQQISVYAAESIWGRLRSLVPEMDSENLLAADEEALRQAGLSRRKVEYIRGIARAFFEGTLNEERLRAMKDGEVKKQLCSLRGIGPWTADMFLIFHLQRPDILPVEDIGLVNAAGRLYGWSDLPDRKNLQKKLTERAERWRPWRTVATWYIWRDLDAEPVIY
ncbi:MAG: DNA-3-methyladenine glycosylase family protein [Spirochaetaceae bacterium]